MSTRANPGQKVSGLWARAIFPDAVHKDPPCWASLPNTASIRHQTAPLPQASKTGTILSLRSQHSAASTVLAGQMDHSDAALTVLTHIPNLPAPSAVTQKAATAHHHHEDLLRCNLGKEQCGRLPQDGKGGGGGGRDGLGVLGNVVRLKLGWRERGCRSVRPPA